MKKIILTGGGTAGHVIPNLALVPALKEAGYEIYYVGSKKGIEKDLVEAAGLPYFGISSGKLRRYVSFKNVTDMFRVIKGLAGAIRLLRKIKPDVVFSKGGFVVVPVIAAAKLLKIKSIIHESDMTPGLANKLAMPFASRVCVSFPETMRHVAKEKAVLTGTPVRPELPLGSRTKGLKFTGIKGNRPVLLVTGGSLGAKAVNTAVRDAFPEIIKSFDIIHLCGKGNLSGITERGYKEFEYVSENMPDILAAADIVVSRAGANILFELAALKKPNLLIPLTAKQSRGDQILNAESFKNQGLSMVLPEEELTIERLVSDIKELYKSRETFMQNMNALDATNGVENIMSVIMR